MRRLSMRLWDRTAMTMRKVSLAVRQVWMLLGMEDSIRTFTAEKSRIQVRFHVLVSSPLYNTDGIHGQQDKEA